MTITLSFYPHFSSQKDLDDHFFRALWFLAPYKDHINEIVFPCEAGLQPPDTPPVWLDPELKKLAGALPARFPTICETEEVDQFAVAADGVLLWVQDHVNAGCLTGKQVIRIDHQHVRHAASFYLLIHERFPALQNDLLRHSREVFGRIRQKCTSDVGYVFGTGPGLSLALEKGYDFSDGVCIACNSMIRNHELMKRINPPLIVVADPIFHAGPSSYAAVFREELIRALDQFDADLIVPMRDYNIYLHHLPSRFTNRIAALPFVKGETPNLDLIENFHVTTTANILTLFLLPLAATFFKETRILGCDGRPMEANTYFWSHDKASQFNEQMNTIKSAHPAFFNIDYDDYYVTHCKILEIWLEKMENSGKIIGNYTPSYIPAIKKRTVKHTADKTREKIIFSIDPEVGSSNGHYLPLNLQSRNASLNMGIDYIVVGNKNTEKIPKNSETSFIIPLFECNTWSFRKRDIGEDVNSYNTFRSNLVDFHDYLIENYHDKEIYIVMYCGCMSSAEALYEIFGEYSHIKISVHLLWCCFIDYKDPSFINRWKDFVHNFLSSNKNKLFGSTESISSGLSEVFSENIVTIPHVTPTYSDSEVLQLLHAPDTSEIDRPVVLSFPALPNAQKGVDLRNRLLWAIASDPELSKFTIQVRGTVPDGLSNLIDLDIWPVELNDEDYKKLFERISVAVQLYLPETFSERSSGLLLDLITNRIPVVCTPGSWVAQFISNHNCGSVSTTHEIDDIILSIKETIINRFQYKKNSRIAAEKWNMDNNWVEFIKKYCLSDEENKLISPPLSKSTNRYDFMYTNPVPEMHRVSHAHVDETAVVAHMLQEQKGHAHIMIDVGAHFGTSASYYDKLDWTIYCFEPDPANREKLIGRLGNRENVIIDTRAVSDKPAKEMSFFKSEESTGISALHAFRDTHKKAETVEVTTVTEVIDQHGISHVDFLKIDVEGFDFNVLKGVPWDKITPDVIECEYEDAKTVPMGHTWRTIADFLCDKGYAVYISEWHPIIRYGISHDWRRVVPYPQMNVPSDSWGNILAFRKDPGLTAVQSAFETLTKLRKAEPNQSNGTAAPMPAPSSAEKAGEAPLTLEDFHNRYRGKRCFIVGNGPSLNKHDLSLLEEEYVFGVNGIFYKTDETGFRPTFFVVEDSKVMEENVERIKAYDVPYKFFPSTYKSLHPHEKNVHFFNMDRGFYDKNGPYYNIPQFSDNAADILYCGQSVTYISLQLAFFMGFSEVYLIGMDFDYTIPQEHERRGDHIISTTDDPNHFHKDYFGRGKTWKDPKLERVAMNYRQAKRSYETAGRQIYNATVGGKLEIFPRVDYETLLRDPATGLKRIEQAAPVLLTPGEGGRQLPARAISHTPQAPQIAISASPAPAIKKEAIPVHSSTERTSAEIRAAKLAKLKRDPHAFFRDSHIAPLRLLHYFFKPATISKWQADMEKQARHEAGGVFSFLPASRKRLAQSRAALKSESSRSEAMLRTELARIQRDFQARETALNNELARARREADEREARSRSEMKAVEDELRQQAAASEQRLTAATEGLAAMETALHNELARARREADEREARSRSEMKAVEDELRQQAAASEQRLTAATEGLAAVETALRAEITDAQDAMKSNFSEQVAAVRTERNEQAEEIRKLGEGLDLSVKKEIASIRNSFDQEKRISAPANAAIWRVHDRHLSQADITHIQQNWLRPLGLFLSPRQLGYIAHHIGLAEERCEGRMATTIQAAMLRTLALLSLQAEEIDLLEIGTLFGIGGGTLYQAGMRAQRKMRLTLLDPLDGYYGQRLTDDMTGVPITRDTLVRNLQTLAVPEEDYRIIQHLSTKQEAIEAASERSYDYLLIDGDHSLEGVAADFELYGPMVKPGGVVIFDDYATTDWPAIQTFVDEHVRGNDDWLWIGGEWRTAILRRKRRASATAPDRTKAPAATGQ